MLAGEFSHYRVLSRLGQGGMGEVYLAEDLLLHRRVALKFLIDDPGDPDARGRLLREARAAARLDHPFICKVYDVDEHDGRSFLAMEYVEGQTLQQRIGGTGISPAAALPIAIEIAEALHHAHSNGIVHRDLKPANVMISADGHAKVMDFGIAKVVGAGAASASTVPTVGMPGEAVGTFAYMSPEQVRGEPVDARSDVFAFGALLYELITGGNPFVRPTAVETAHAILNDAAPSLQTRSGVSPLLAHVVERCLHKDRARRYQTLGDVRSELQTIGGGEVHRPRVGRRWMAAAVIAVALAIAAVANWVRPLPLFAPENVLAFKERDWIVVADFNNLTGDKVFDRSLRLALEVAIAQSQYVNVYPQDRITATLQRMQRWPVDRLDENLASEVAARNGVRGVLACDIAQLGNTYSLTARLIGPAAHVTVLRHSVTAESKDKVLAALDALATHVRGQLGESSAALSQQTRPLPHVTTSSLDALKLYADALRAARDEERSNSDAMLQQAVALDPDFALAHAELGRRLYLAADRGSRQRGEEHFVKALSSIDRLSLRERLWLQAVAEESRGRREQAAVAYETYVAQYPEDSRALFRLGWTQMAGLREYAKSIETFKRVVSLAPEDASAWVNLATAYSGLDDMTNANEMYKKAFVLTPSLEYNIFINHEYGFSLVRAGRVADAAATFERMKTAAEPPSTKARGFRSLALLMMHLGKYAAAANELRQAIVIDHTYSQGVSEFRDRLFLVTALEARGLTRDAAAEWATVTTRITNLSLTPEWLTLPIRMHARAGRIDAARRLLELMKKTTGQAIADASVARNTALDQAYADVARAEIELASGRAARALDLLEPASIVLKEPGSLESLARAYAAAGKTTQAIERYEEFLRTPHLGNEVQDSWNKAFVALAALYERDGRPKDAVRTYRALLDRWKEADPDIPLLNTARQALARLENS